jgi:PAS domain S-box-containing protein
LSDTSGALRVAEQLRLLVDAVSEYAIFLLDRDGHIQTWNTGARRLKGYTPEEIIGKHFSIFYTQEDIARDHPAEELRIAAREGRYEEEGWRLRKDGSRFWANVVITALRNEQGILVGYAKITRDLTSRREAEEELRRTAQELERSNAELERFASAAAHDLVEPLHTIAGLTDLVMRRHADKLDDDGREALGHVRAGAERLRGLVDGLLAYARASHEALERAPVPVGNAIDNVLSGLRMSLEERGARIERSSDHLGTVLADERLLELVLQNLIANALKFNDREHPLVAISCEPTDGELRLTVADDGIGIAPAYQEQVFGLFSRLHGVDRYPGTGMGLALCRRIIERHGGDMGVDSALGEGSRFWFTLPAA